MRRIYLAFELVTLEGLSGGEAGRLTGLSRNAVYKANKRVLQRLTELGAPYREEGRLTQRIKEALEQRPPPAVERAVTVRVQQTMRSRSAGVAVRPPPQQSERPRQSPL